VTRGHRVIDDFASSQLPFPAVPLIVLVSCLSIGGSTTHVRDSLPPQVDDGSRDSLSGSSPRLLHSTADFVPFGMPQPPALAGAAGDVIRVSTAADLEHAVAHLRSGTTVLVAPGTYQLRGELRIRGVHDVSIRGATGQPGDVVIRGSGMSIAGVNVLVHVQQSRVVLIADLSLRDAYYHLLQLHGEDGTDQVRVYNVRFADAGQQFIKASIDLSHPNGVDDTIVEYSVFEYSRTGPPSGYTAAIDILRGANWQIRHNLFRNITAPRGVPPAVLAWHGTRNIVTDRNTFIDCARGILYGIQPQPQYGHSNDGGVISNNMITYTRPDGGDAGISLWDSPNTRVRHNSVVVGAGFPNAIEYRFPGTTRVEIVNNLNDAQIAGRDGAQALLSGNATLPADVLASASVGDLHLTSRARAALAGGVRLPDPGVDWDGDPRPADSAPDIGADQFTGQRP